MFFSKPRPMVESPSTCRAGISMPMMWRDWISIHMPASALSSKYSTQSQCVSSTNRICLYNRWDLYICHTVSITNSTCPILPILYLSMSTPTSSSTLPISKNAIQPAAMESLHTERIVAHAAQQLTSYMDGLSRSGNPDYWWKVVDIVWHELVCYPLRSPTITF